MPELQRTANRHLSIYRFYSQKDAQKPLAEPHICHLLKLIHLLPLPRYNDGFCYPSAFQTLCGCLSLATSNSEPCRQARRKCSSQSSSPCEIRQCSKGEMMLRCPQITLHTVLYCLEETLGTSPENLEGRITYGIFCVSSQRLKNRPENDLRCPSTAYDF